MQLAVALPRCGRAAVALEALCSLQEAAELDSGTAESGTAAGLLKAALQVRICHVVRLLTGSRTWLCICA
jgi:hypothetical protein